MESRRVHFVGIGGIGMSALAQLLVERGERVSGSDREESPTTHLLRERGIAVHIGEEANLPQGVELVIYSDAVPAENAQRQAARAAGIRQISYFEMLGEVSRGARTLAVAGTHGKTTTTGMLAHILERCGKRPTAIVGSIVRDFSPPASGSNFLAGDPDLFVVEACEYRDHLLELSPEILVITNLELDHTDYFPSLSALQATFRTAIERVPAQGAIVAAVGDPNIAPLLSAAKARVIDYTIERAPKLRLIGEFNAMNARAAKAAAKAGFPDLAEEDIDAALVSFRGSWRRFEYKGEVGGALVYDDYAHHPTAIQKTLEAAREAFPDKKIIVAFHPHLYSRTRDLFEGFIAALARADRVILAPIYAARERDTHSVSSDTLAEAISAKGTDALSLHSFEEIERELTAIAAPGQLIITMGAGDIYKVADNLVAAAR